MRIGIITLWNSTDNYGQQLQSWALQRKLMEMGHEPYLIQYDNSKGSCRPHKPIWRKILKAMFIYPIIIKLSRIHKQKIEYAQKEYNKKMNQARNFVEFRKQHIRTSEVVYPNLKALKENPPQADVYITGSDQVWTYLLNDTENNVMYLDFGTDNVRRIAYAPSFAMPEYPAELTARLSENLKRLDYISVREETGKKICEKLGFDARVVVDPTLLLYSKDYDTIKNTKKTTDNYIYLYYLNIRKTSEIEWKQLKLFCKKNNYQILATPASGYFAGRELFDDVTYKYATIPEWIDYISNAEMVVTTSFHGVVFCLLNHTPFVFFPLKGKYSRGNSRVVDLCSKLQLNDRIWNEHSDFATLRDSVIDWNFVDKILEEERKMSMEYLNKALL